MQKLIHLEIDASDILTEASLSNLKNGTQREFGQGRKQRSNQVNITNVSFVPSIQSSSLLIKATTQTNGKPDDYITQIKFSNVKYVNEASPGVVTINAEDGTEYFIKPLTHAQATVKVRCTCLDFYFMFSAWNQQRGSLDGAAMPPYVKKTDSELRNPNRIQGACKHITKLGDYLKFKQIIR